MDIANELIDLEFSGSDQESTSHYQPDYYSSLRWWTTFDFKRFVWEKFYSVHQVNSQVYPRRKANEKVPFCFVLAHLLSSQKKTCTFMLSLNYSFDMRSRQSNTLCMTQAAIMATIWSGISYNPSKRESFSDFIKVPRYQQGQTTFVTVETPRLSSPNHLFQHEAAMIFSSRVFLFFTL